MAEAQAVTEPETQPVDPQTLPCEPNLSDEGYRARLFAIEWHGELWRRNGVPAEYCRRMIAYCTEYLDAAFYEEPFPVTSDPEIERMRTYLWGVFESPHRGPQSFA